MPSTSLGFILQSPPKNSTAKQNASPAVPIESPLLDPRINRVVNIAIALTVGGVLVVNTVYLIRIV